MRTLLASLICIISLSAYAQNTKIQWLSFPELEVALSKFPKPVLIHFYADWCAYCHKMENAAYTNSDVVTALHNNYYAVKFDVESTDSITFGGKTFINANMDKKRRAYHQIPEFLAGRNTQPLTLPATILLDSSFTITERHYRYLSPKDLVSILKH